MSYNSEKVEIIDNFKRRIYGALPCLFCFYYLIIMVEISIIFNISLSSAAEPPGFSPNNRILQALIIIPVSTIPLFFTLYLIKTLAPMKDRKFLISKMGIEIAVPNKETFRIEWNEFDKLRIIQKKETIGSANYRIYDLNFHDNGGIRTFNIYIADFRRKIVNEIFRLLKKYTNIMDKEFMAYKEGGETLII